MWGTLNTNYSCDSRNHFAGNFDKLCQYSCYKEGVVYLSLFNLYENIYKASVYIGDTRSEFCSLGQSSTIRII